MLRIVHLHRQDPTPINDSVPLVETSYSLNVTRERCKHKLRLTLASACAGQITYMDGPFCFTTLDKRKSERVLIILVHSQKNVINKNNSGSREPTKKISKEKIVRNEKKIANGVVRGQLSKTRLISVKLMKPFKMYKI